MTTRALNLLFLFFLRISPAIAAATSASSTADEANDADDCTLSSGGFRNCKQAYINAQSYVTNTDEHLTEFYFSDDKQMKRVQHLIIGRGVAGTNLFSARYATKVLENEEAYKCDGQPVSPNEDLYLHEINGDGSDVLIVGDEETGLWNTATYTLAQPYSALTFPYLPYNPMDFVSPERVERDEFVSCVDMHKSILTSQCAIQAPVLTALVLDIELSKKPTTQYGKECLDLEGNFVVTLQRQNKEKIKSERVICVDEIDIVTGRGLPRKVFQGKYPIPGVDEAEYNRIRKRGSSRFGENAPLLIDFRELVLTPDEDVSFVAQPIKDVNNDKVLPRILIDGGGGTVLAAIRSAMLAKDDISKNIVYTAPDSSFNDTKNPQMIRQVLRKPETQNAIVKWVSRGDLNDNSLRGGNQVRSGSAYSIVDLYESPVSKSIYNDFGGMYFNYNLQSVDFKSDPMVATFAPYPYDENSPTFYLLTVEFDQFVTCIGEDDTIERQELYGGSRFGESTILYGYLQQLRIPYGVGFEETGENLRILGVAATNLDLFPRDAAVTFTSESQDVANRGRVVPLHFTGNMLSMMSQLQVYTTTTKSKWSKRLAKINLSMSTEEIILRFMDEACVPRESSRAFLTCLRGFNNKIQNKNGVDWPINPNGIGIVDLREYIKKDEGLSKNVFVSKGKGLTLVSMHDQPCDVTGTVTIPSGPASSGLLKILRSGLVHSVAIVLAYCGLMLL